MGFLQDSLSPGEKLAHSTGLHWIVLVRPILFCLVSLGLGVAFQQVWWLFVGLAVIVFIAAIIVYRSTEYGVSNSRVIGKTGFISRRTTETILTSIESMDVNQSIFGRMLNYGNIVIQGTGGGDEEFRTVASPFEFRRTVNTQIDAMRREQ